MTDIHPFDEAAAEIAEWIDGEASYYAEALRGGHRTPFSASVSESEKLDYYRRQAFETNPDGTPDLTKPNTQGRDMLMKRLGIPGYTRVMAAILPRQAPLQDEVDPMLPDMPE